MIPAFSSRDLDQGAGSPRHRPGRHPSQPEGEERREVAEKQAVEAEREEPPGGEGDSPDRPAGDHLEGEDGREGMEGERRRPVTLGERGEGPGHAATRAREMEQAAKQADGARRVTAWRPGMEQDEPGDPTKAGSRPGADSSLSDGQAHSARPYRP